MLQARRAPDALSRLKAGLKRHPGNPDIITLMGMILFQSGDTPSAKDVLAPIRARKDGDPGYLNVYALCLETSGDFLEALPVLERLKSVAPSDDVNKRLGFCHASLDQPEKALPLLEPLVPEYPDDMNLLNRLGLVLSDLQRLEEAEALFRRISDPPATVLYNLGNCLLDQHKAFEALAVFERVLALDPNHAPSAVHRAQAMMLSAVTADDWRAAWLAYEARWRERERVSLWRDWETPVWDGGALGERHLLIHAEQGLGDTIQFCRFARQAAKRGGTVSLVVQPSLERLLACLEPAISVQAFGRPLPQYDLHIPAMSLPRVLGVNPATLDGAAYLSALPEIVTAWRARLPETDKPRVGVSWKALGEKRLSAERSCPSGQITRLARAGLSVVSLQKDLPAKDPNPPGGFLDVSANLTDFAETAALIETLDLVVSVDTAVAHLAGALGKPVVVLLPFGSDWRWGMESSGTPWYGGAVLVRQAAPGDWAGVIDQALIEMETRL